MSMRFQPGPIMDHRAFIAALVWIWIISLFPPIVWCPIYFPDLVADAFENLGKVTLDSTPMQCYSYSYWFSVSITYNLLGQGRSSSRAYWWAGASLHQSPNNLDHDGMTDAEGQCKIAKEGLSDPVHKTKTYIFLIVPFTLCQQIRNTSLLGRSPTTNFDLPHRRIFTNGVGDINCKWVHLAISLSAHCKCDCDSSAIRHSHQESHDHNCAAISLDHSSSGGRIS